MTLDQINRCGRDAFVDALGAIFEHSPWVAERAWPRRPFRSRDDLHAAMVEVMLAANRDEQLALLCAHPDLGSRARMSAVSSGEQAGAGLDRLTRDQYDRLTTLNATYRARFGFPFVLAVKGSSAHDILEVLASRLHHHPGVEWQEALTQVSRIAGFRLDAVIE